MFSLLLYLGLPIHWKTMPEKQRLFYDLAKFDSATEDISFNTEAFEESNQPVTNKISEFNIINRKDEKNQYTFFKTIKNGVAYFQEYFYNGIEQLEPNITDGKVSVKDNTITWVQRFHYVLTREYKIPIGKLVPKK